MDKPIFSNAQQAITATFHMNQRLAIYVSWLTLWVVHLGAAFLLLLALWWFQVTPARVEAASLSWLASTHNAVLGVVGVSAVTVVTGYVWLVRWIWARTFGEWHINNLMQDL